MGLANNHAWVKKTNWTRQGAEDFLVRQMTERVDGSVLHHLDLNPDE
jgi:hypothetical protein